MDWPESNVENRRTNTIELYERKVERALFFEGQWGASFILALKEN